MNVLKVKNILFTEYKIRYFFEPLPFDIKIYPLENFNVKDINFCFTEFKKGINYIDCVTCIIAPKAYMIYFSDDNNSEDGFLSYNPKNKKQKNYEEFKTFIYQKGEAFCFYEPIHSK